MSIRVDALSKWYGTQEALKKISFEINKGEIVGFIGPNGAGKSTTMKVITGFLAPSSGSINVCGIDVAENPLKTKQLIGYLPENNPLYLNMYVREYLNFVAGMYKLPKPRQNRVNEMIEKTGLIPEVHKKLGQLSKGYRQRVGMAQALIHNPEVLILDEPTSGLDPNQVLDMRNLISEIGKEKTIMLSTHIMQEVEAICDRILIINNGSIVADRLASGIHDSSESLQTFHIEFKETVPEVFFEGLTGIEKHVSINKNQWLISSQRDMDIRESIFKKAVSEGYTILQIVKQEKKLEDVFRELTKGSNEIIG